jgi:hypothetical protein
MMLIDSRSGDAGDEFPIFDFNEQTKRARRARLTVRVDRGASVRL